MSSASIIVLERRASAESRELVRHVTELKSRLEPQHVVEEATNQLKDGMRTATHRAATHMKTPYGMATTITSIGFIAAALVARNHVARNRAAEPLVGSGATTTAASRTRGGEPLRSILSIAAALGLGLGANKLASITDKDNDLLVGLSTEVKSAMDRWTRDQVEQLARPGPERGFGLLNLAAMALGLFARPRDRAR